MYLVEDILKMLENEKPEILAQNFADALNEAIAKKKAVEDALKAQEAKAREKKDKLDAVLDAFVEWVKEYYPEDFSEEASIKADEIIKIFDETHELYNKLKAGELPKRPKFQKSTTVDADEEIKKFLRALGV